MSGLRPEVEAQRNIDLELRRLEQRKGQRKGSLAARFAAYRKAAEKEMRKLETRLSNIRHAESLHRSDPSLTESQIVKIVNRARRGRR